MNKVLLALEYLIETHAEWKKRDINMEEVKSKLKNPVLVDNTTEEAGEASNVEQTESVKVFFPDGTMSTVQGGQENLERYKELVQKAKSNGYDIELNLDLMKEATRDYQENNLVNACLLQYPFRGGLHENRKRPDGTMSRNVSIEEYLKHLSMLSQPQFHHDLFSLILYNMSMKQGWSKLRASLCSATS